MKFMVLLYQDPAYFPTDQAGRDRLGAAFEAFTQSTKTAGSYVDGWPLVPMADQTRTVTTKAVTNGPQRAHPLVGYYVLEYPSLDAAAKAVAAVPCASTGSVEVVPFMDM